MSPTDWFMAIGIALIAIIILYSAISQWISFARIPKIYPYVSALHIHRGDVLLMRLPKGTRHFDMTITSLSNFLVLRGETKLAGWKDINHKPPVWTNTAFLGPEHGEIMRFVVLKGTMLWFETSIPVTYGKTNLWAWFIRPDDSVGMERVWHAIGNAMS